MSSNRLEFEEIKRAALARFDDIMGRFLPGGTFEGADYVVKNPTRTDNRPGNFKINRNSGKWSDFATGDSGKDLISLVAYIESC